MRENFPYILFFFILNKSTSLSGRPEAKSAIGSIKKSYFRNRNHINQYIWGAIHQSILILFVRYKIISIYYVKSNLIWCSKYALRWLVGTRPGVYIRSEWMSKLICKPSVFNARCEWNSSMYFDFFEYWTTTHHYLEGQSQNYLLDQRTVIFYTKLSNNQYYTWGEIW